ncbi:MAG TPA: kynureninase [Bacillales bacterium]|nr:kynureninase [Bacillales bacterium]
MQTTKSYAKQMDNQDELARFKNEFYIPENTLYMDGNSLGLLSKKAEQSVADIMDNWKTHAIDGWTKGKHPWYFMAEQLAEQTSPLIGALPKEVIVTNSTTVNLHQLVSTFYHPEGNRTKVLADELNFPSDIYALKSQLTVHGYDHEKHLVQVKSRDRRTLAEEDIISAMRDDIALIVLPAVLYRSGQLLDIQKLAKAAHERGILIGIDACHSIGAVPHQFHDDGVDFAFWCNYKYLNNGPGGTAGLFVHEKHLGTNPGLAGWFGSEKDKQFDMEHEFTPAETAGAYQIGTPHILSMAPLIGSLDLFRDAGIHNLRRKSLKLTAYLMELVREELADMDFTIGNPIKDEKRGGHVCLEHPEAARICKALKKNGVIPDFRSPNVIRLAPVAMYTSFTDVWETVRILKEIMTYKQYEQFKNERDIIA